MKRLCVSLSHPDTQGTSTLTDLPASLKRDMLQVMAQNTLNKLPLFRNLDADLLMTIYSKLVPMRCAPGEVLVRKGRRHTGMIFLMQGAVVAISQRGREATVVAARSRPCHHRRRDHGTPRHVLSLTHTTRHFSLPVTHLQRLHMPSPAGVVNLCRGMGK